MKATEHLTTVEKGPSAVRVDIALNWLTEHFEQLSAMSMALEERLSERCERQKNEAPPLMEWRLAQVLNDLLTSMKVQNGISDLLRMEDVKEVALG